MEKLNELVEALYPKYGAPGSRDVDVTTRRKAIDESAAAIAEAFRALEQEVQKNLEGALAWQQRAEAAEAKLATAERAIDNLDAERSVMRAKLAELEKQQPVAWTDEQELRDVKNHGCGYLFTVDPVTSNAAPRRIINLFTRPAPAVSLAGLVPDEMVVEPFSRPVDAQKALESRAEGFNLCRAAILRNIEEAK